MRISNGACYVLTAFAAVTLLAGWAGGNARAALTPAGLVRGSVPAQIAQDGHVKGVLAAYGGIVYGRSLTTASFMSPRALGKPLLFVSDYANNVVDIYLQGGKNKMVGQITGLNGPGGLATDSNGNLYIANYGGSTGGNVTVYAPPYTGSPTLTLDDPGYSPYTVAVSSSGVAAVVNFCNAPSCAAGSSSVNFYATNSTMPCATLTPNLANLLGGTFSAKGTLYVLGANVSGAEVVGEIRGACEATKITLLTTNSPLGPAVGAIHVDKADRIAISAPGGSSSPAVIKTFRQPKRGSLGDPVLTTPLTSTPNYCGFDFSFLASGRSLYADGCGQAAQEYDFPVGGTAEKTITFPSGSAVGVAATPPLVP
jgi:hypothetical protein